MIQDFANNVAENFGIYDLETESIGNDKIEDFEPSISKIGSHIPIFGKLETIFEINSEYSTTTALPTASTIGTTTSTSTVTSSSSMSKYNHISRIDKVKYLADFAKFYFTDQYNNAADESVSFSEPMLNDSEEVLSRQKRQFSVFSLMNFLLVVFNVILDINNNINKYETENIQRILNLLNSYSLSAAIVLHFFWKT